NRSAPWPVGRREDRSPDDGTRRGGGPDGPGGSGRAAPAVAAGRLRPRVRRRACVGLAALPDRGGTAPVPVPARGAVAVQRGRRAAAPRRGSAGELSGVRRPRDRKRPGTAPMDRRQSRGAGGTRGGG